MNKPKTLLILSAILVIGLNINLVSQPAYTTKTKIAFDKFEPLSDESHNLVLEESIPYLIKLGFLNQGSFTFISGDSIDLENIRNSKKEQINRQNAYKSNIRILKTRTDLIIYGDYSYTSKEIYIIPKLYDLKNEKNYTLKSVKIDLRSCFITSLAVCVRRCPGDYLELNN